MSTLVGSSASAGAANLDGIQVCRMFNRAIARQTLPGCLSSDNDPMFLFHRWLANLRVREVDEIKTVPSTPRSHAFVERLIGTIRREFLDRTLFWSQGDLELKLEAYQAYLYSLRWLPQTSVTYKHRLSVGECDPDSFDEVAVVVTRYIGFGKRAEGRCGTLDVSYS